MRLTPLLCATLAGPAVAEQITCNLSGMPVSFAVDRAQFAPAVDAQEPAQRRITTVQMGDATFPAEPILIGDLRGFWTQAQDGAERTLTAQGDGSAIYVDARDDLRISGTCAVQR